MVLQLKLRKSRSLPGSQRPEDQNPFIMSEIQKPALHVSGARVFCYASSMRALIQRVTSASVKVDDETIAEIGPGLLVLVCAMRGDGDEEADYLAAKISKLRVFADAEGKTNLSIAEVGGKVLVVSQFTLAADWRKGNRPGFSRAAPPDEGERLYDLFCQNLRDAGLPVETGRFAAMMQVALVNDGPFTLWMDTAR